MSRNSVVLSHTLIYVVNENQLNLCGGRPEIKQCRKVMPQARLQSITLGHLTPQTFFCSRNTETETSYFRSTSSIGQTPCCKPEAHNHVKADENVRSQYCDDLSASLSKVCQLETQSENSDGKHVIVPVQC
jgi:hypothetical protein